MGVHFVVVKRDRKVVWMDGDILLMMVVVMRRWRGYLCEGIVNMCVVLEWLYALLVCSLSGCW